MSYFVCPSCGQPDRMVEEVEVTVAGSRTVRCDVRDGKPQVGVGPVETEPSMFDVEADLYEGAPRSLACECGWEGRLGDLVQVGWDGPVRRPARGQLELVA